MVNGTDILKRLGWIAASPFLLVLILLYFIVGFSLTILVDPFIWIITGKTFFMAYMEGRLWNRGELLGEKTDFEI